MALALHSPALTSKSASMFVTGTKRERAQPPGGPAAGTLRVPRAAALLRYLMSSVTVWLQSPSPAFVHDRTRNSTAVAGVSPEIIVLA